MRTKETERMKSRNISIEYNDGGWEYFKSVNYTYHSGSGNNEKITIVCGPDGGTQSRFTRCLASIERMNSYQRGIPESYPPQSYTEADLVSFGEYVLSTERILNIFKNHTDQNHPDPFEAIRQVYHADLENWKETLKEDECGCGEGEACSSCHEDVINAITPNTAWPEGNGFSESDMKDFTGYCLSNSGSIDHLFDKWKQGERWNQSDS